MLSNMDGILVWAWMLWKSYALERGCYSGLGMDALIIVCSRTWMILWLGHGCSAYRMLSYMDVIMAVGMHGSSGNRMLSNMDVATVWARMLWQTYAL